jgi:hypothetical protein
MAVDDVRAWPARGDRLVMSRLPHAAGGIHEVGA